MPAVALPMIAWSEIEVLAVPQDAMKKIAESTRSRWRYRPQAVICASLGNAPKWTFESELLDLADALAAGLNLRSSHVHGMLQSMKPAIQSDAARVSSELASQGRWTTCRVGQKFFVRFEVRPRYSLQTQAQELRWKSNVLLDFL